MAATIKPIDGRSIHLIQSGQVIVDLCSVAKELVENSIDAGANIIDVRFKNQGLDLIEVQDNGSGISPANYSSIALKHHTSKLSSYSDIAALQTFGFRGEALASLCALSSVKITTCLEADVPKGTKLGFENSGNLASTTVVASQRGTTVSVEKLFHNLPVRRRELERNVKREWHKVIALLNQYACIQTNLKFSVSQQPTKGNRILLFATKGNPTTRENVINIFGSKAMSTLVSLDVQLELQPSALGPGLQRAQHADENSRTVRIVGHVSRPVHGDGRQMPDRQMFFVNGRPCGLPQFAKTFNEVYKSYNYSQSPFILANIQLDTSMYDVNVSPDKRSILLHDQSSLLDQLRSSLVTLFDSHDHPIPTNQILTKGASSHQTSVDVIRHSTVSGKGIPLASKSNTSTSESDHELLSDPDLTEDSPLKVSINFSHDGSSEGETNKGRQRLLNQRPKHDTIPTHDSGVTEQNAQTETAQRSLHPFPGRRATPLAPLAGTQCASQSESSDTLNDRPNTMPRNTAAVKAGKIFHDVDKISSNSQIPTSQSPIPVSDIPSRFSDHQNENDVSMLPRRKQRSREDAVSETRKEYGSSRPSTLNRAGKVSGLNENENTRMQSFQSPESDNSRDDVTGDEFDSSHGNTQPRSDDASSPEDISHGTSRSASQNIEDNEFIHQKTTFHGDQGHVDPRNGDKTSSFDLASNRTRAFGTGLRQKLTTTQTSRILRVTEATLASLSSLWRDSSVRHYSGPVADPVADINAPDAESKLHLIVAKNDFSKMRVVGQFNLGFIIAVCPKSHQPGQQAGEFGHTDELFIIDQHASDEKFNFERLQTNTVVQSQRLVHPKTLQLTALEEEVVSANLSALDANGFKIHADFTGRLPVGARCQLLSLPLSRETTFTLSDLEELIGLLADQPSGSRHIPRPSKVQKMLAMRACRGSIMIGKALTSSKMYMLLRHMGELDKPWNCPHGRPTMRHLGCLQAWDKAKWVADLPGSSTPGSWLSYSTGS